MRIETIVHTMTTHSIDKGVISPEQAEVYEYGLALILTTIFSFIVALFWGLIFQCLAEVIAFLVVFIPLRMYTGGYHASTYFRCLLAFISMLAILKLFIDWISSSLIAPITVGISLITLVSVFLFAPIQHPNAPIRDSDRPKFKHIAWLICLFDVMLVSVFINSPLYKASYTSIITAINCGLFFSSVLIIIGQLTHTGKEVNAKCTK
jgi:accessory gene regulator B